ncbi:MAG: HipA family kinase [Dehalococcoidia bacterium]
MRRLQGVRYVVPLREGGSLPAVVETDVGGAFVVKFRGAGQGPKALVAEALAAGLARLFDLPVPEPAIVVLERDFGKGEPDPEIQDILRGSAGENFGLAFLMGALAFDPAVDRTVDPDLAAAIVWFDAFITNVDRTVRNTNLLVRHEQVWLIDHGASLYFHHNWKGWESRIQSPFPPIKDHVLLHVAGDLAAADRRLRPLATDAAIRAVVDDVPAAWLDDEPAVGDAAAVRDAYVTYLTARLHGPRDWLQEAIDAQSREPERLARRLTHRVTGQR